MIKCPHCTKENPQDASYCNSCGRNLRTRKVVNSSQSSLEQEKMQEEAKKQSAREKARPAGASKQSSMGQKQEKMNEESKKQNAKDKARPAADRVTPCDR